MSSEMKRWVGKHRRGLHKAWKAELKARDISWQQFCDEMWNIWTGLANCRPEEVSHV